MGKPVNIPYGLLGMIIANLAGEMNNLAFLDNGHTVSIVPKIY